MTLPVRIRAASESDVSHLAAIRRDAILVLAAPELGDERAREWADSSAEERVLRAIVEHDVWVAERDGVPIGWVEIDQACVQGLYVSPAHARRGIGSGLLLHAEARIRREGHAEAALDASRNAERFYVSRGYEARSEERADRGRPMKKSLPCSDIPRSW